MKRSTINANFSKFTVKNVLLFSGSMLE